MFFADRKKKAQALVKSADADALLITHLPDVRYLCGFTGSNAALAFYGRRVVLFTDGRYTTQARQEAVGARVVIAKKSALREACAWLETAGATRCGFDAGHTTVAALDAMREMVSGKLRRRFFLPLQSPIAKIREVKDAGEIALMRESALLGCRLYEHILGFIAAGISETAVAAELEYAARLAGAEAMSFDTIVASGLRSALPHGHATGARLPRNGFLTLDFGVILNGYCSDMTRTVYLGRASETERGVYDAVLAAQEAAVAAVAPGATCGDVDEAARSVLRQAKLDRWFTHSTGHGVGLEIHEGPRIAAAQQQKLEPGMVITIEPGVYMEGKFGIRIEDMVLVTATGHEVLTPAPKAWTTL
jgi:Xaa-Pro aminopeptidase